MEYKGRILLHACCGVCASHCVRVLKADGWEPVLFYSNANIWPSEEYTRRLHAAQQLAEVEQIEFAEDPPDHARWREEAAKGFEECKEGGARCARCFKYSLTRAFQSLKELRCDAFTTSLSVSPHKRSATLHAVGKQVGGNLFIPYDFKKKDGFLKSTRRADELGLYRQIYCGCEFSVRHRDPFRTIILGMGYRGRIYARWALEHPSDLTVTAIADPNPAIREEWRRKLGLPEDRCFSDWRVAFDGFTAEAKDAPEAAVIALPDALHFEAAMLALDKNLHLLLEKPIAATWDDCVALNNEIKAQQRVVRVGHILRYTPYYRHITDILRSGALGEVVSIRHIEPVGYAKAAHAFVRGPFADTANGTPMIVQKCSHDFDLFSWWIDSPCIAVQSFGELSHFRPDQAPADAAARCTECPKETERNCPFSAVRMLRDRADLRYALPDSSDVGIEKELAGRYGRCVYTCNAKAVDHQQVNLLFANGVTVSHSMESFTWGRDRETAIFLTHGEIRGDARTITVKNFRTRTETRWDAALETGNATHESSYVLGNAGLMHDWVTAMRTLPATERYRSFHSCIQAHAMAFAAEFSRRHNGIAVPLAAL